MSDSLSSSRCPECHGVIPPEAPWGLCPLCLLRQAVPPDGADPRETAPSLVEVAAAFPNLEILELIGQGGMGVVYKSRQRSLNRLVALKLLAPGRQSAPGFTARFQREAQALAELNHPNIVTIHDFGQSGGYFFLLMEYLDGVNLRQAMAAGRLTPEQALAVVPPICEALQFAHNRGIIHRDIKPENLLLDRLGRVKIADFGIARILGREETSESSYAPSAAASPLTGDRLLGTPGYMAPEQRQSQGAVDHRADIYSLGVVLYELLTGELPGSALQPPSRKVRIDVRLDEIVLRALDARPELRYSTVAELGSELEGVTHSREPVAARGAAPRSPDVLAPSRSRPPRLLKSGRSTLITQEELRTISGQLFLGCRQGVLRLDEERLTYTRNFTETVIELADIQQLDIGRYPRSMNIAGIDFLAITFHRPGGPERLILSPNGGLFGFAPSTFNRGIQTWYEAIIDAMARLGRTPERIDAEELRISSHPIVVAVMSVGLLSPFVFLAIFLAVRTLIVPAHFADSPNELDGGLSQPRSTPRPMPIAPDPPPVTMDFQLQQVEVTPGSHTIVVRFKRDQRYGLALEVSQDVAASADGKLPHRGFRHSSHTLWIGRDDSPTLSWTLPDDFTEDEVRDAAREVERRARLIQQLPEGAVASLANVQHRDGWTCSLILRVRREPGSPCPPLPAGATFTVEQPVVLPAESDVRLRLQTRSAGDQPAAAAESLVFRTARDRSTGVVVRWTYYAARHEGVSARWFLDLVDPDTGVTFDRQEHSLPLGMQATSPDHQPLPTRNPPVRLVLPGTVTYLGLLKITESPSRPNSIARGLDQLLEMQLISPREERVTPRFQMSPLTPDPALSRPPTDLPRGSGHE